MDTRAFSKKQENKVAKIVKGKVVANSGATAFNKGDVRTDRILIECKTCTKEKESFSIKKDWLIKNKDEAFAMRKDYSVLAFDFGDGKNYFIIDENLFKKLVNYIEEEN